MKSRKKSAGKSADPAEPLEDLLERLGIERWDYLIVGDGSGSNWGRAAGWASVSVERLTMERLVWTGAMNLATVNFAEIMAYVQPLSYLVSREIERRGKNRVRLVAHKVHIVTDSQYVANTINGKDRTMAKNAALWASLDVFSRLGFTLTGHWLGRDGCGLNNYSDKLSKMYRHLIKEADYPRALESESSSSPGVYDINPSAED